MNKFLIVLFFVLLFLFNASAESINVFETPKYSSLTEPLTILGTTVEVSGCETYKVGTIINMKITVKDNGSPAVGAEVNLIIRDSGGTEYYNQDRIVGTYANGIVDFSVNTADWPKGSYDAFIGATSVYGQVNVDKYGCINLYDDPPKPPKSAKEKDSPNWLEKMGLWFVNKFL